MKEKKMKRVSVRIGKFLSIAILIIFAFCQIANAQAIPEVRTDKNIYNANDQIIVTYFGAPGAVDDWICIIPAGTPDDEAGNYKYLAYKMKQGVVIFDPPAPGTYEVRVYYNYGKKGYEVSARQVFSVTSGPR
jgi:hypothetical protein